MFWARRIKTSYRQGLPALAVSLLLALSGQTAALADVVQLANPAMFNELQIPTYVWREESSKNPKAIVVGFHGGCLHGRSFNTLARTLAADNIMFVSFDMRGYGRWYHEHLGTARDQTFNYTNTIKDIESLLTKLHAQYPQTPVYCIGESLGANMAMVIGYKMPTLTNGIILVSPFFGARKFFDPHMLANLGQLILHPKSELDMSPYLRKRLAQNPQLALREINDPLGRNKQTAKELGQSLMLNLSGRRKFLKLNPNLAVLVIHGCKDKLCNPRATQRIFKRLANANKQIASPPDTGHLTVEAAEINSKTKEQIADWINRQSLYQVAQQRNKTPEPIIQSDNIEILRERTSAFVRLRKS